MSTRQIVVGWYAAYNTYCRYVLDATGEERAP